MRDRLIELLRNAPKTDVVYGDIKLDKPVQTLRTFADHLLANGVIVPPCKVGDTVYLPWKWKDASGIAVLTVERISITESGQSIRTDFWSDDEGYWLAYNCGVYKFDDIGKTVFLTKEEAEKALKGGAEK